VLHPLESEALVLRAPADSGLTLNRVPRGSERPDSRFTFNRGAQLPAADRRSVRSSIPRMAPNGFKARGMRAQRA
jgi:hypothetical protein